LNIIFLHQLTEQNGSFKVLQDSLSGITEDRRIQLLLIAFSFGAFFEGAAGFGTPVAVTAAILIGLGFSPLAASGLSLIANTAPVAFGALGTPVITLAKVHGYDLMEVTAMIGRQLPFFSVLVPFWLIWAFAGRKAMWEIWPAILVAGVSFAIPQYLVSNFMGPELVDIIAALVSIACLVGFLRVWKPKNIWTSAAIRGKDISASEAKPPQPRVQHSKSALIAAWTPWVILSVFVFIWGMPPVKAWLNSLFAPAFPMVGLHNLIEKMPPVVAGPTKEGAVYTLNLLSATGTAILLAAIVSAFVMKYNPVAIVRTFFKTIWLVRFSLLTIVLMLALGTLTRYSGTDTTLGLAFANTGVFYPFFGTLMGWLGVALTGSDTASNVLFGGMQKVAAEQLGLSPNLMGAANSSGGVMGKMIDAQSIVVASTATRWFDREGDILRYVFFHSIALACLMGLFVTLQAYVWPFHLMVVH
ncbi:MAG: L-lactate permease, partial [Comamonas sp.]|nr:L-lactate permease [Comamonas sp.]